MSELPHDPIDELLHRAHNNTEGAPPSFQGRLRARMAAEAVVQKQTRVLFIKVGVAIAALLILGVAIGMNVDLFLPTASTIEPQPQAKVNEPAPATDAEEPAPEPAGNNDQPEPEPQPELEPEDPKPQPEPTQPDEVEKPEPEKPIEPERQPEPQPEPVKPDDVIEKPDPDAEPVKPDGTEVKPPVPSNHWVEVSVTGEQKLRFKYGRNDWQPYTGDKLLDGVFLKASAKAVDLALSDGGIARFNGEMQVSLDDGELRFDLNDDSLYVDNLSTTQPVTVMAAGHIASMDNGVGVFYRVSNGFEVACLADEMFLNDIKVEVGFTRRATKRGLGEPKAWRNDRFLRNLPERSMLREDFDKAPPGGMYDDGERIENGIAIMDQEPRYLAFNFEPELVVVPGMVLRFRVRATDVTKLELELFEPTDIKLLKRTTPRMFKHTWKKVDNGEWLELELTVADIPDRDDPEIFPIQGTLLRNFKMHYQGGKQAKLEIDWVEFVRVQN